MKSSVPVSPSFCLSKTAKCFCVSISQLVFPVSFACQSLTEVLFQILWFSIQPVLPSSCTTVYLPIHWGCITVFFPVSFCHCCFMSAFLNTKPSSLYLLPILTAYLLPTFASFSNKLVFNLCVSSGSHAFGSKSCFTEPVHAVLLFAFHPSFPNHCFKYLKRNPRQRGTLRGRR